MKRRTFLKAASTAIVVGTTIALTGCCDCDCGCKDCECGKSEGLFHAEQETTTGFNKSFFGKKKITDEDFYKIEIEEEGIKLGIACEKGGKRMQQYVYAGNPDVTKEIAAEYLEAYGRDSSELTGKTCTQIEYDMILSENIKYGIVTGEISDFIVLEVPDGTTVEITIKIGYEGGEIELEPIEFDMETEYLSAVLGSRCVSVEH